MPSFFGNRLAEILFRELCRIDTEMAGRFERLYTDSRYATRPASDLDNLNSFWREQLESLERATIAERDYLCYSESFDVWLDHFRHYVLPTVIDNHLPRRL